MKKLLLVDDEESVIKTPAKFFQTLGYEVDTAESGEKAIKLYKENRYDLILLDLGLLDMDGTKVFEEVKAIDETVKVCVISGYEDREEEVLKMGVLEFIHKPIRITKMAEIVKKYCPLEG